MINRLHPRWTDLRPALLTVSTILLLLGSFLTLVALLTIALRSPQDVYIHPLGLDRAMVIGGEGGFVAVVTRVATELATAVLLMLAGAVGVVTIRRRPEQA